jgi:hypothetical protein
VQLFLSSALLELQAAHLERQHLRKLFNPLRLGGIGFGCLVNLISLDGVRISVLPGSVEVFFV